MRGIGAIGVPDTPETARSVDSFRMNVLEFWYMSNKVKLGTYLDAFFIKFWREIAKKLSSFLQFLLSIAKIWYKNTLKADLSPFFEITGQTFWSPSKETGHCPVARAEFSI